MSYQVVIFDMDGTLITSQRSILPETGKAVAQLQKKGIKIVLVTGRHHIMVKPFHHTLRLNTPAICCNGAYLYEFQDQTLSNLNALSITETTVVIELARKYQIDAMLYVDDAMYYEQQGDYLTEVYEWIGQLDDSLKPHMSYVDDLLSKMNEVKYLYKVACRADNIASLQSFAKDVIQNTSLSCEWSWSNHVDISQQGNSKGAALSVWAKNNQIDLQSIVAFGDSYNDISMFQQVGLAIAMGNADPEVKHHANDVIDDYSTPAIAQKLTELFHL